MDTDRIKEIAQHTLGHLHDNHATHDEVIVRIMADPVKKARWEHFAELCGNWENIPGAELDKVESDYYEKVYMPTLLKINLDVAKAMVVAAEQEIANLEA